MNSDKTVVVAMSGGVDSSVAAALLVRQGYRVIGMMLRLWSEPGTEAANRCCTPDAMGLARSIAGSLGIPFYPVDVRESFRDTVVEYFIDGYSRGLTPNPCLVCNREIRWGILREHAEALGAHYLATGHYARLETASDGTVSLLRAVDRNKDQSYILSVLSQNQLRSTLFPVGGYTKSEIRLLAKDFGLPSAARADSQDLCFVTSGDYRQFYQRHSSDASRAGPIRNVQGMQIGEHLGLENYTIGQRKGLGINSAVPLYVVDKIQDQNALVVGEKAELGKLKLIAREANWIAALPGNTPFDAKVQIRYRAQEAGALVYPANSTRFTVQFNEPVPDITPGQLAVVYRGETCLGSGVIEAGIP
jgi:tRNA-specific 2-thiouridylase